MILKKIHFCFFLVFFSNIISAQSSDINIIVNDSCGYLTHKVLLSDTLSKENALKNILTFYNRQGFFNLTIDSLNKKNQINIQKNKRAIWKNLVLADSFHKKNYTFINYFGREFNNDDLENIFSSYLSYYWQNGYPFAEVRPASFLFVNDSISAIYNISTNQKVYFDTLIIKGNVKIRPAYLRQFLTIPKGGLFNQNKIKEIPEIFNSIAFMKPIRDCELNFRDSLADLYLYLKPVNANKFSGYAGFGNKKGTFIIAGELNLYLINLFKQGELFDLKWKKTDNASQNLNFSCKYPFLMNTKFSVFNNSSLVKKDSTFLILRNSFGVTAFITHRLELSFFHEWKKSSSLQKDIMVSDLNFGLNLSGFSFVYNGLNNYYLPSSGFFAEIDIAGGLKKDKIQNERTYRFQSKIEYVYYITKYLPFKLSLTNGLLNSRFISLTDMFRLGAITNLRGIDEESLYTSEFSLLSFDFFMVFDKPSAFFIFSDFCYYKNDSIEVKSNSLVFSSGLGLQLKLNEAVFKLIYAVPKIEEKRVDFINSKIQISYITNF